MDDIFQDLSLSQKDFLLAMKAMGERRNIPNISWDTAEYLFNLLTPLIRGDGGGFEEDRKEIKSILEIGPANGFSTLILGIACPQAQIISIECSRHAFEELRENLFKFSQINKETRLPDGQELIKKKGGNCFLPAEFGPKVTSSINQEIIGNHQLYYADARELLPVFQAGSSMVVCENPKSELHDIPKLGFDCIFIDGAFRMTRDFFDLSLPLLQQGGTIIIDDAIKYAWKMDGFHEYLQSMHISYELVQTDEDDGIMVIEMK